ncbi:MAG: DNA-directed RNA polymerase subunit beta [Planctomycetes bacterium]|jgi:DNA-directed RNA polymerase subunit beta|nr:DNA-directed RNA polymerase subunit beta [Planctomycetota bacterium]
MTATATPIVFGRYSHIIDVPDLTEIQRKAYKEFLMVNTPQASRPTHGLEELLREVFPIYSYDKTMCLEYVGYELGRPRYTIEECRKLRLTFGYPFKVRLRLVKPEPVEEEVYLGEIPLMIGGGEFIINGSERVIVSQLHRSPGVDFSVDTASADRKLHSCWIIPERGSWIELNVTKKEILTVRIDQSGKFSAVTLLRALDERYSTDRDILNEFYTTTTVKKGKTQTDNAFAKSITGKIAVGDIVVLKTGEVLVPSATPISEAAAQEITAGDLAEVEVIDADPADLDMLIINSLHEDPCKSHSEALLKIYGRLRPGNPPQLEKARELFHEKFFDPQRYRLGRVGRFRLNRKYNQVIAEEIQVLQPDDIVNSVKYLIGLRNGKGFVDDIDNLGNRRVRTIAELASEEFRKGLLKLRRTAQERMNLENPETVSPRNLINSKTFSSAVDYFFGRGELSQVVDQTNPLSQLTHERRLSALGPGGLNRKRAGFDVRDVHLSHYGRLCPIETPEGSNIGLISSLALYSKLDAYGFLVAPYREVDKGGKVTDEVVYLRADEEQGKVIAPADTGIDDNLKLLGLRVLARRDGDNVEVPPANVDYVDVSPKQIIGVSAALIPFLEHDDANRALMGSNMQRQAVPLLITEPPLVGTGMERIVADNTDLCLRAEKAGTVSYADSQVILVDDEEFRLTKYRGLNERTCQNHKPVVVEGDVVKEGQLLADGAATRDGELALGRNILVAFMPWEGLNFEDAILVSQRLVRDDVFTSIHIEEYEVEIRETKLGKEEFTRDIPNVGEKALGQLDEGGIVRIGTPVENGDILVGKVAPKSKSELTPEEKLLHAIFGRAGVDVKNASLNMPPGTRGVVIDAQKFSRRVNLTDAERQRVLTQIRDAEKDFLKAFRELTASMLEEVQKALGTKITDDITGEKVSLDDTATFDTLRRVKLLCMAASEDASPARREAALNCVNDHQLRIERRESDKNKVVNRLSRGDELPTGVLEMVKVYVATKRTLSVGDKMAGRHGNKGVVSKIMPIEDMPYLEDGQTVDIVLNPLGVPSRMNVGQILETHLGLAAKHLGTRYSTPAFDGAREEEIENALAEAGLPTTGKFTLFDGRTGQAFEQEVTVGIMYMLKLHHLVDEKVHARATGPYSLITQQPLGGKARFGGQRFGEMEVWALEAYGAAAILQEQLTVKSDDVDGRTKIYESMVKGLNILEPGTPVSFEVLCNEIKGLGLNIELQKKATL